MKKIIISIFAVGLVVVAGVFAFRIFLKPPLPVLEQQPSAGKCGDNICDEFEKANGKKIYQNSPFGFVQGSFDENYQYDTTYKNMLDLGVYWDRPFEGHAGTMWNDIETKRGGKGVYDFSKSDEMFSRVFKNNKINLFISLVMVNELYGSDISLENRNGSPYPTDAKAINAYKNFVKAIVKRYSANIKYWMVGQNEFDDIAPMAKGLMAYSDEGLNKMAEYAGAACEAIKEVCSDCRPVIGGSVFPITSFSKKGDRVFMPDGKTVEVKEDGVYFRLLPKIKNECENLIIDYHFWPKPNKKDYLVQKTIIGNILKIKPNAEIWNTESGSVSVGSLEGGKFTEYDQARDIARIYVYALAHGQKKIFWTNTLEYDWTKDDNSEFENMGLINNPKNTDGQSHKKLSYYAYKKMTEVLEGSDWDNIQTVQEKDGVYVYKFIKTTDSRCPDGVKCVWQGKLTQEPIWVAWNDNNGEKQVTISGINSNQIKITEAVPKYETGKEVEDYETAFNSYSKQVYNGKIVLTIKDKPIFVEEK